MNNLENKNLNNLSEKEINKNLELNKQISNIIKLIGEGISYKKGTQSIEINTKKDNNGKTYIEILSGEMKTPNDFSYYELIIENFLNSDFINKKMLLHYGLIETKGTYEKLTNIKDKQKVVDNIQLYIYEYEKLKIIKKTKEKLK